MAERLTIENALDVLQLARQLCDAPDLYLKCMKFLSSNFKKVEETEGWKFLQDHDPCLELEILQFMNEADSRKKRRRRHRRERSLYLQLSEAMVCFGTPKDVEAHGINLAIRGFHVAILIHAEASSF